MSYYDVLKISPDSTIKEIKQAYSILLKDNSPEKNPEGYQLVREAYDYAIKIAKGKSRVENTTEKIIPDKKYNDEVESLEIDYDEKLPNKYYYKEEIKLETQDESARYKVEKFIEKLNGIYSNIDLRENKDSWKELFNDIIIWDVDGYKMIQAYLVNFILINDPIPKSTLELVDNIFGFIENKDNLIELYGQEVIDNIIKKILRTSSNLSFKYVNELKGNSLEKYTFFREQAYECFNNNDTKGFKINADKAYKIYKDDLILISLYIKYYVNIDRYKTAYNYCRIAINIDKSYETCMYYGIVLRHIKKYKEAIDFLEVCLNDTPESEEIIYNLALSYYYTNDYKKAYKFFVKYSKYNGEISRLYLNNIKKKLKNKLRFKVKLMEYTNKEKIRMSKRGKKKKTKKFMPKFINYLYLYIIALFFSHLPKNIVVNIITAAVITIMIYYFVLFIGTIVQIIIGLFFRNIRDFNNKNIKNKTRVKVKLKDITYTNYYYIPSLGYFTEEEIEATDSWLDIEGSLYCGYLNDYVVFFLDTKGKVNLSYKDNYKIMGRADNLDNKIYEDYINKIVVENSKVKFIIA